MKERAIRFGSAGTLIGIITEPPPEQRRPGGVGVVFLSSGMLHRVGACRMHVRMARAVADRGLTSLRFDFSGMGDSDTRRDALPFEQSGVLEAREAMQQLTELRGVTHFVLVGLCSGADIGFYTAQQDERVVGVVQIDPFVYRTWKYYIHRYGPRLLRLESWLNLLTGRTYIGPWLRRKFSPSAPQGETVDTSELVQSPYARAFPPREVVAEGLRGLVSRKVAMLDIFSDGQEEHYNHQGQYAASFAGVDFQGLLREEYRPGATHIFTDLHDQAWLDDLIVTWSCAQADLRAYASTTAAPEPAVAV
jgi:pimeloyl-ACP methyl ester carboxylesterase